MAALETSIPSLCGIFADYQVERQQQDDLPLHVKGPRVWFCNGTTTDGTFSRLTVGYQIGEGEEGIAVEFLRVSGQDNWYQLLPKEGDTEADSFWITNSDCRFSRHSEETKQRQLGFWRKTNPQHPQYASYKLRQEIEIQDQAEAHLHSEPAGGPSDPRAQELLIGGLHHIATLKGKQPLHKSPPVILQEIERHVSEGREIPTYLEPLAALEPTLAET